VAPSGTVMLPLLVPLLLLDPSAPDEPFLELAFEPALERAGREQKILLVDFSAGWCEPCHKMERDTWARPEVGAWLGENAIAIQVDYDEETALAERFAITSLPTVLAFRDGTEFERLVGYHGPDEFLSWGRDVRAGRSKLDLLRARSAELGASEDIEKRLELVGELAEAELYDEALLHYRWLWSATGKDPRYGGMRFDSLLDDMAALARVHEPAAKAFAELLAKMQVEVDAVPVPDETLWREWSALCEHFQVPERILAWYEGHRDGEGHLRAASEPSSTRIEDVVMRHLVMAARVQDAARLVADPMARAEHLVERYKTIKQRRQEAGDSWSDGAESYSRGRLIEDVAVLRAVLVAAGRSEEASAVGARLIEVFDAPDARLGLVSWTLELVGHGDPDVERWLVEAERRGGNTLKLRRRLAELSGEPEHH